MKRKPKKELQMFFSCYEAHPSYTYLYVNILNLKFKIIK